VNAQWHNVFNLLWRGEFMSEDLTKYVGERRLELRAVGVRVGSDVVQQVAQRVLNGLVTHGAALGGFGYLDRSGQRLQSRHDQSVELTSARPEVARGKTATRVQAGEAFRSAKKVHRRLHALVDGALSEVRDALPAEQFSRYALTVKQTRAVGASPQALQRNMVSLASVAEAPELADELKARGVADAGAQLRSAAAAMTADVAAAQLERGTKAESEEIDVLDGLIIEELRSIRRIARNAADELGRPDIAEAFALAEFN
jgi:hypothetical protein